MTDIYGRTVGRDYLSGVRQHWTGGDPETLWRCPGCEFQVVDSRQPEPCEDHPFDEMTVAADW